MFLLCVVHSVAAYRVSRTVCVGQVTDHSRGRDTTVHHGHGTAQLTASPPGVRRRTWLSL